MTDATGDLLGLDSYTKLRAHGQNLLQAVGFIVGMYFGRCRLVI